MERRKPVRLIVLILCACLLLGSAAPVFGASISDEEAVDRVFEQIYNSYYGHGTPPWDRTAVPGFSDEEVIQYFVEVTMYGEYDGYRGYLMRYETPITYCILGEADADDIQQLEYLAETLNTIEGYPGITRTWDVDKAVIKVMFSSEIAAEEYYDLQIPANSWGYASVWYYTGGEHKGRITGTKVWISNDAWPRNARDSVICEEFIQGQGMLNDPSYGYYSIFDQYRNDCDWPSPLDWAVVRLLYDPRMDMLASESEIRATAQEILESWKY